MGVGAERAVVSADPYPVVSMGAILVVRVCWPTDEAVKAAFVLVTVERTIGFMEELS